jgi:thiosulfate/3-mercaptopyruvate sulfurtransferase
VPIEVPREGEPLPSPLVSPELLHAWIERGDPTLRVVDVRWYLGRPAGSGRVAYAEGHVPGAIFLDVDVDLVAPTGPGRHPLPDPNAFRRSLEVAGITDGDTVVAYDDVGGWVAARLWWMLDDLGWDGGGGPRGEHARSRAGRVAILDGGFPAWQRSGLPVSSVVPTLARGRIATLRDRWSRTVDREGLKARLGEVVLLDARAAARYRGEIEPIDPIAGHIPTALSAPTDDNLDADGRFLDASALRGRYLELARQAGLETGGGDSAAIETVISCGSGISACHDAVAMRIAGLPDPILYPGSYSDWSRSGEPVATGPDPGTPPDRGRIATASGGA